MNIVIYLYKGITALDAIGPYEVLSKLPDASIKFVAEKKGLILSDNHFLKLSADYDITEIHNADILLIPGSVIGFVRQVKNKHVKKWILKIHQTTQWTVTVCTGSIILASTGLLAGLCATSHWAAIHLLADYDVSAKKERFVREGKIITAQGVSAGIDMALYLAAQIAGEEYAKACQLLLEYFPEPPLGLNSAEEVTAELYTQAKKTMAVDVKKDLSFLDVAGNLRMLQHLNNGK